MDKTIRKGLVFYQDEVAGEIMEYNGEYVFQYDVDFLEKNIPISMSLPVQKEPFRSKQLFSFFKGLLPEGWYLNIVSSTQKVDSKDDFGVLLSTAGLDTIGAVTVRQIE